ncbi:FAD-binding domain-containing protein [Penicillium macrosclerotiorum]|uniref:FAD-binding domain-containing protein n=1 Tax=Penicillium macrosclerotiorum TaxID=303699 RepID=UPI002546DB0D|nr:FAD-binding domain-containing protein [Penicillium macrosclerotiorum]KAJ5669171.1 FAD-binding domain-containing protein [Penicillium macrosclerotiorum]
MTRILAPLACLVASASAGANSRFVQGSDSSAQDVSTGCRRACSELSSNFGPAFHWPQNDNFTIWDAKQQEIHPACRVEPSSAADVAKILEVLVAHWCYFSVKGGGHSRNPGDSNSVGGVTVDLDRLKSVDILQGGTMARVGGGATSLQVYEALGSQNLSFVGGRVGSVGIGGFTLGGGTSPFSNKYGWSLDNIYEYEVVLANGTITIASETHNPDLYFALRGGGNNFGIVTAFTMRTFLQGPVFTSMTTYAANQSNQVLDKVYDLYTDEHLTSDKEMGYDLYYTYSAAGDEFTLSGTQRYGKAVQDPPVFQAINRIPTLSRSTAIGPMSQVVDGTDSMGTTRHLFATLSVAPSRALLSHGLKIFQEEVEAIKKVPGLVPNFICYPLQKNAIAAMKRRGGNALGIDRDEPLFLILISTAWSNSIDDAAVNRMTANTIERLNATANDLGVANRYIYINYASGTQANSVFFGYGDENLQRLKRTQKAVDPYGIFTSKGLWRGFVKLL